MDIDKLTIGQARELAALLGGVPKSPSHSLHVGDCVLIRTVTMAYTGRIVAITDSDIVLEDAAWIACTARYNDTLTTGALAEVEPYPDGVIVARGGLIDVAPWTHPFPREQK